MRILRITAGLLIVSIGLAGCSSTSGLRTGDSSKIKTIASIGDKPLPVVTGAPGSSVAADEYTAERPARTEGRISGRVLDDRGDPVSNARIQVAVSGAAGGKLVRATTDRSGGFTLHGLRPGSSYTVIAEDDQGDLTGRARVRAPDAEVQISLAPKDAAPARAAAPRRVNPISNPTADRIEEADDEEVPPATGLKREDTLPPAPEAESFVPRRRPGAAVADSNARASATARWRKGEPARTAALPAGGADAVPLDPVSNDPESRGNAPATEEAPLDDDGPNPLPPALEPGRTSQAEPGKPRSSAASPARIAKRPRRPPDPEPGAAVPVPETYIPISLAEGTPTHRPQRPVASFTKPTVSEAEIFALSDSGGARPLPDGLGDPSPAGASPPQTSSRTSDPFETQSPNEAPVTTNAGAVLTDSATPVIGSHDPFETAAAPEARAVSMSGIARVGEGEAPSEPNPATQLTNGSAGAAPSPGTGNSVVSDPFQTPEPQPQSEPSAPVRSRPTWGELTASLAGPPVPIDNLVPPDRQDASTAGAARPVSLSPQDPRTAYCQYDDRHRRIMEFGLPDLEGRTVRFQDLDADLILLDFWGTWCAPCVDSIPHLVALQTRMGKRLQVVGIACEQGPREGRAAHVAEAVRRLGINYPVLLSGMEGNTCPVQQALQVQAFPTLILVDRQGRVLWRDQGATPVTLRRLNDSIASAIQSDTVRR